MAKDPNNHYQIRPVVEILGTAEEVDLTQSGYIREDDEAKVFLTFTRYPSVKFADLNFNLAESDIPENRS